MFNKIYQIIGLILVLASGIIAACSSSAAAVEPDKVTVQLSWFHTVEYAGFYAAEKQGYYAAENLAVKLVPGSVDTSPLQDVIEGKADFGIAGGDNLTIGRAKGAEVKAIATIFRQSPIVFMALADSGIKTPQDFVGKRVGIFSPVKDNTNDISLLAMLRKLRIEESEAKLVVIEDYSVGSLTSGAMDIYSGFSTNELVDAQRNNMAMNTIFPQDYGVLIYANVLFTSQKMTTDRPDLVERFARATLKGYQYALEHVDESVDLTLQYDNTLDAAFQRDSMLAQIPLIDTGDAPIGTMDETIWQQTQEILLEQEFISAPMDVKTLYTNEFVEKHNNK